MTEPELGDRWDRPLRRTHRLTRWTEMMEDDLGFLLPAAGASAVVDAREGNGSDVGLGKVRAGNTHQDFG